MGWLRGNDTPVGTRGRAFDNTLLGGEIWSLLQQTRISNQLTPMAAFVG